MVNRKPRANLAMLSPFPPTHAAYSPCASFFPFFPLLLSLHLPSLSPLTFPFPAAAAQNQATAPPRETSTHQPALSNPALVNARRRSDRLGGEARGCMCVVGLSSVYVWVRVSVVSARVAVTFRPTHPLSPGNMQRFPRHELCRAPRPHLSFPPNQPRPPCPTALHLVRARRKRTPGLTQDTRGSGQR